MKKIVTTVMVLATLAAVFTGCSKKAAANSSDVTKGMDRKIVMGYSQIGAESEWRTACTNSVKQAAADWNIDLKFSDAQQKQENQMKAIRSFIQQKVDIIAFTPVVETGWEEILQECKDAGIPTLCVDRTIAQGKDSDLFTAYMGSDFELEGKRAVDWLVKYMNDHGRGNEQINVVQLEGTMGAAAQTGRKKAFEENLAKYPNYKIIKDQTGDFTRAGGKQVMEAWMKSADANKINVLFSQNDDMALGAIQAIEEAGKKPGKDIIIIGCDGVKGGFQAMVEGKMNCSVECNPLLGPTVMETAVKVLTGQPVQKWVISPEGVYDETTAAAALPERKY
jgi:galactofuranose transport system substrate-binding protein